MADRDGKNDPYRSYRFRVEIDGIDRGGFRECSGLDYSQDPIDYREGADPLNVHSLMDDRNRPIRGDHNDDNIRMLCREAQGGIVASPSG